jgi:hypothetical protein
VSGRWERDAYDGQPLSNLERGTAQFRIDRQLIPGLNVQVHGSVNRTNFANVDFSETDVLVGGSLIFREGHATEIRLRYDHTSRAVAGVGSGYTENRIFLTLGYKPKTLAPTFWGPGRATTPRQDPAT